MLTDAGFDLTYVAPVIFAAHPNDHFWKWFSLFVNGELASWVKSERVTTSRAQDVLDDIADAECDGRDPRLH